MPAHQTANQTIDFRLSLPASSERVFDAWITPNMLCQWMFGPALRNEEILRLETDPRVDGMFSFVVRRGEMELNHYGVYTQVDRPSHLAFTWGVDRARDAASELEISILPAESGAVLTLRHHGVPREYAERTLAAWQKMLGVMARVLADQG